MVDFAQHTFKEKARAIGKYHKFWAPPTYPFDGDQFVVTESKRGDMPISFFHKRNSRGKFTSGGPWLQFSRTMVRGGDKIRVTNNTGGLAYDGSFVLTNADDYLAHWPRSQGAVWDAAYEYGAEAMKALRPDQPDFGAAMALMELKDLVPELRERTRAMAKAVAKRLQSKGLKPQSTPPIPTSESKWKKFNDSRQQGAERFLAVEMGWIPLMSDIVGFSLAYLNRDKKFQQMLRDEGKPVRRRRVINKSAEFDLKGEWDSNAWQQEMMFPSLVTQCYQSGAPLPHGTWNYGATRRTWLSGQSRYLLPPGPRNDRWTAEIQRRVLGLNWLTPGNAYNLIPWSWLVDYFTGLGDFIEATGPGIADQWVIDYAYIMDNTKVYLHNTAQQNVFTSAGVASRANAFRKIDEEYKVRVQASLFGWGLSQGDLSPKQVGILGALGLSRL
jgi:hypothetical protein